MSDTQLYDVEAIIGHKVVRGKEKYHVKWVGYPESEATWEPIENLFNVMDQVEAYMATIEKDERVIDQIIGCGQRNGDRYFLVRFKNATENEIIDWDTAKKFSLQVMEYFGSKLVWNPIQDIEDPETGLTDQNSNADPIASTSSQSSAPNKAPRPPPNDIEYENDDN